MHNHGWTDEQAQSTIPTLLVGRAKQEFNATPPHYPDPDQTASTFKRTMTYLDHRMSPYNNPRTARTESKNLAQGEKVSIRKFSRRVRSLSEIANNRMNASREQINEPRTNI